MFFLRKERTLANCQGGLMKCRGVALQWTRRHPIQKEEVNYSWSGYALETKISSA